MCSEVSLEDGTFALSTNGVVQPDIVETFAWADYDNDSHLKAMTS